MLFLDCYKKPKILIVDDEEGIRETLKERLEINDINILTASNGREGLNAALAYKPNIIVTDIAMPAMNGLEMIAAIRTTNVGKNIPIIIITVSRTREDNDEARKMGVEEYLTKPFEMSELLGKIEKLLETSACQISLH